MATPLSKVEELLTPEQRRLIVRASGTTEYSYMRVRIYDDKVELLGLVNK